MKTKWTSFLRQAPGLAIGRALTLAGLLLLPLAGAPAAPNAAPPSGDGSNHGASAPPSFQRTPNPAAAGLWIGQVTLGAVTYAATGVVGPTRSTAQMRIILHVDATGKVRLLKDVIVAARRAPDAEDAPLPFTTFIVTKPALLATLPLDGTIKGQRFSTVAYDFTDNDADATDAALDLTGGLGPNFECVGTLLLDKLHPTNPFRHKFHPDHANDGAKAYAITRNLRLQFTNPIQSVAGVDHLDGAYQETVTGLHRAALTAQGTVQLTRVATTATLNQ